MKITLKFLEENNACSDGVDWWEENKPQEIDHEDLCKMLLEKNKFLYANWLVCKLLPTRSCIKYAINAAELVLFIFEKKHPKDDRPRKEIEAAKKYRETAASYPDADAYASAYAAAADASYPASAAAYAASYAASAYADAAAAADASYNTDSAEIKSKIIKYGMRLIEKQEEK